MRNKQILLSGRAITTNAANVPADRYSFLHLSDAEPNLGTASANGWVLVYDTATPGNRLWSKNLITAYDHANSAYGSQNTTGVYANAAFLKANSAYDSQNTTGTYANAAFLKANSAYESQNVTGTYANNAYDQANSAASYANSAFLKANSAYASQNVTGTYANNAYDQANSAASYANSAFLKANSAYGSQNTTGTYANAAYAQANSASLYANGAFIQANAAYNSQNVTGTYANNAYVRANNSLNANVGGTVTGNVTIVGDLVSNTLTTTGSGGNITGANAIFANYIFAKNIDLQLLANSAYAQANSASLYANGAFVQANAAYGSQNTTGTYANAAFLKANSAYGSQNVTGTYANAAYAQANSASLYANGAFVQSNAGFLHANSAYESQNTTGVYANAAFLKANSAYDSQNVTGTYANNAYVRANNSLDANVGGTVTGPVTVQGDFSVVGNVFLTGNTFSLSVGSIVSNDSLLILGANNFYSDTVDIGISAHYNDGVNAHSGLIRDATNKEWYLFKGYTPELSPNNNIILTDPSFTADTLNANLKSNNTIVRGIEIGYYANAAFLQANTAYESQNVTGTYANSAYAQANSASLYANGAFVEANAAYESQNVTGTYANNAYTHANAAFLKANSAYESQNVTGVYANAAYAQANSASLYANGAFVQANSAYESQNVTGTYANNAYAQANSASLYANGAFVQANAAYEQANSASLYANGAFIQANASYNSQNVTGTYANNAYAQANSAALYANGAFIHANAAFDTVNNLSAIANTTNTTIIAVSDQANAAFLKANSAYESQNVTGTYANNAYIHANSAFAEQNLTFAYANAGFLKTNSAYQHANSSYDSQNTTGLYANAAFTKANAAVFTITPNTSEIWVNTSTGNIQIGLANVNTNIGTWGGNEAIPVITTDGHGRILSVSNTTISVPPGTYIFPNTNQLTSNAISGNVLLGLANVNTNIGTWGGTEAIPVINVDGYGRIVSVTNTTISVPPGTYIFPNTGQLTANASSGNIKIGLAEVAQNVGIYGSSISIPAMNIDIYGRVLSVTNSAISIPEGTYITNSNLIIANSSTGNVVLGLAPSGVSAGTYGGTGQTPVLTVDQYGRVTVAANVAAAVNTLSTIVRNSYTATAAQTAFDTTSSFTPGYADVYVNGIKLSPDDYVANPVGSINIVNPTLLDGDVVDIQTATTFIVDANTKYEKVTFNATAAQTTFTTSYTPGNVNVYLNGLRLKETDDYQANNGTSIILSAACELNDIVEIEKIGTMYTYLDNIFLSTRQTIVVPSNGQTTFTITGGYKLSFVDVYLNGIKLNIPNDVTASDGSTITILTPSLEENDIIEVVGLGREFTPANAIAVTGGTVYGSLSVLNNVNVTNAITANTLNVNLANINSNLQVTYNVTANAVNVATVYFNDGTFMSTAASGRGDGITWKIASANVTANLGEGIMVDTTSANVYVTLNASPYTGNTTRILDMTGNFAINNCIVKGNGQKIMGSTDDLVISSNNAGIGLVYSNSTHGWRLIENP